MSLSASTAAAATTLSLACVGQTDRGQSICGQMRDVIAASLPGTSVRLRGPDALPETGPAVRLHVEKFKSTGMSAHLEWRQRDQGWQRGETMSVSVMDHVLTDDGVERFLKTLWKHCPIGQHGLQ